MKKTIRIIGSGFSSLCAACYLAKAGHEVSVYEKNEALGGRARRFEKDGFTFDMGPTWYWMPDVFERFFSDFNKQASDFYTLEKLDPAYSVYFKEEDRLDIASSLEKINEIFEKEEKGSSKHLNEFLKKAKKNYEVAIKDLVYQPGVSPLELISPKSIGLLNQIFGNIEKEVRKNIKSEKLRKILEFPVLFLGAKPSDTPPLYSFMNWADFGLGTWHPKGGMYAVVEGIVKLAKSLGVKLYTNATVSKIETVENKVVGIVVGNETISADIVLSGADYVHSETLLKPKYRQYSEKYWDKKTLSPSSLLFYVGFNKKIKNVSHHTLFFDSDFKEHAESIYDTKSWPKEPLFYASFPSISDDYFAPEGQESATFLIPLAPDLEDNEEYREKYFNIILDRFEKITGESIRENIVFSKSYCVMDFISDYNSYKGNAYGLANTLLQTAFLRPNLKSSKLENLYFTGQLTVPGPGVPPALISGKIVSELIIKNHL